MLVLGIESATPIASVALVNEKGLVAEMTLNIGLTHSEQLLPLLDQLLKQSGYKLKDIKCMGISSGPGSFTGLRIGMATAKALAQGVQIPLLAVPTLEAMAWQYRGSIGLISPMQNARREQIYGALYRWDMDLADVKARPILKEVIPAKAMAARDWSKCLIKFAEPISLMGDGALDYSLIWQEELGCKAQILPAYLAIARGTYVAMAAREKFLAGQTQDFYNMKPMYIRGIK